MFAILWLLAKITLIGLLALMGLVVGFVLLAEDARSRQEGSLEAACWADLDIDPRYRR